MVVENAAAYFHAHRRKMLYAEYEARDAPIDRCLIASADKAIVQAGFKRNGMRWSRDGREYVSDSWADLGSARWDPMWQGLMGMALEPAA